VPIRLLDGGRQEELGHLAMAHIELARRIGTFSLLGARRADLVLLQRTHTRRHHAAEFGHVSGVGKPLSNHGPGGSAEVDCRTRPSLVGTAVEVVGDRLHRLLEVWVLNVNWRPVAPWKVLQTIQFRSRLTPKSLEYGAKVRAVRIPDGGPAAMQLFAMLQILDDAGSLPRLPSGLHKRMKLVGFR